jgi:hypothetical protein
MTATRKPTPAQKRALIAAIDNGGRTSSDPYQLRTITTLVREGWMTEPDGRTLEVTEAGCRAAGRHDIADQMRADWIGAEMVAEWHKIARQGEVAQAGSVEFACYAGAMANADDTMYERYGDSADERYMTTEWCEIAVVTYGELKDSGIYADESEQPAPAYDAPAREVRALDADETTAPTMFDPALTFYADGTPVVARAAGLDGERRGIAAGRVKGFPYDFQLIRWNDGGEHAVAPHVVSRDEMPASLAVVTYGELKDSGLYADEG